MKLEYQTDPDGSLIFTGRVDSAELLNERIAVAIAKDVVHQIADCVVLEKGAEVMAQVNIDAIANMVMAEVVSRMASRISITPEVSR